LWDNQNKNFGSSRLSRHWQFLTYNNPVAHFWKTSAEKVKSFYHFEPFFLSCDDLKYLHTISTSSFALKFSSSAKKCQFLKKSISFWYKNALTMEVIFFSKPTITLWKNAFVSLSASSSGYGKKIPLVDISLNLLEFSALINILSLNYFKLQI